MACVDTTPYRCPGEAQPISRAMHLARLSAFFPACRGCPHRSDHHPLPAKVVRQLAAWQTLHPVATPSAETLGGRHAADFSPRHARHLAAALGVLLQQGTEAQPGPPPRVAIAADGRPLLAEYVAQVAEGIRWSGCGLIDLGVATAPATALGQALLGADAAIYLGSQQGQPHEVALKFWARQGQPLSRGAGLEDIESLAAALPGRPSRRSGPLARADITATYLRRVRGYYHALRPLRFVLETASWPFRRELHALLQSVAPQALPIAAAGAIQPLAGGEAQRKLSIDPLSRRMAQSIANQGAHFGLWVDGDGERLRLWDELGQETPSHRLLWLLASHRLPARLGASVVTEDSLQGESRLLLDLWLQTWQATRVAANPQRFAMDAALKASHDTHGAEAALGGGPSGRYWLPVSATTLRRLASDQTANATETAAATPSGMVDETSPPISAWPTIFLPDALEVLTDLLVILSGSDQPLSQALAAQS